MKWHCLSIDVEHWYDATLASGSDGPREPWHAERETDAVLAMLERSGATATFFVLGAVAQQAPQLVRRIADAGHEVACHGWSHALLAELGPQAFRNAAKDARALLQDFSRQEVGGYRAATWSLGPGTSWASGILAELGFRYDSSVFPLKTPLYGVKGAPRAPYRIRTETVELLELPPAVAAVGPLPLPLAGGIYWRVLPAGVVRWGLRGLARPGVLYAHPWEIAPSDWRLPSDTGAVAKLAMRFGQGHLRHVLDVLLEGTQLRPLRSLAAELEGRPLRLYTWRAGGLRPE